MKKMILTVALLSGLSFANAQTATTNAPADNATHQKKQLTPEERSDKDVAWAQKNLGLNADQSSKWKAASLEKIRANEALREKSKGSTTPEERQQMRGQMKSNGDKFDATVTAFLTPEQKANFEQKKKDREDMHKRKMHHKGDQPNAEPANKN